MILTSLIATQISVPNAEAAYPTTWNLVAVSSYANVFGSTTLNLPRFSNGLYFYNTASNSIGFSPTSSITQNQADTNAGSCTFDGGLRLSLHTITNTTGGYRVGCTLSLNSDVNSYKAFYQSNDPSYFPYGIQVNVPESTLTSGGWTRCYINTMAVGLSSSPTEVTTPCTQSFIAMAGYASTYSNPTLASTPQQPTLVSTSGSSATFAGTAVSGASGYVANIFNKTDETFTSLSIPSGNISSFTVNGLLSGKNYFISLVTLGTANTSYLSTNSAPLFFMSQKLATSVSISSTTNLIYRSTSVITANLTGADGKVTFFQNGKRIAGCISLNSISLAATCTIKPTFRGVLRLSASLVPISASYANSTSSEILVNVSPRTSNR